MSTVQIIFDALMPVSYGQFYVSSDDDFPDLPAAFAGQENGLCGAAVAGGLFLITATHTGRVPLRIELLDSEPAEAESAWEEVVEAGFVPDGDGVWLQSWGDDSWELDLGGHTSYRVRYCATDMARCREAERTDVDQPACDRYLMQFWPVSDEAPGPDAVLRQTSAHAAYWHGFAREQPPPPNAEQRAAADRAAEQERRRSAEDYRRREELRRWGGRAPGERLRRVQGDIFGLVKLDRDLVDAVAAVEPAQQRAIARWAARHAYTFARIADLDWVAPALAALDHGGVLPEPFDDQMRVWDRLQGAGGRGEASLRIVEVRLCYGEPEPAFLDADVDPVAMAVPAVFAAVEADPLQAALEALWAAATAYGRDAARLLAEVRRAFPDLA